MNIHIFCQLLFDTVYGIIYCDGEGRKKMNILLKKQPVKYLKRADPKTREKLQNALRKLAELDGDIVKLEGTKNRYRYKIPHYRIIFEWEKGSINIIVIEINARTNIKY